MHGITMIILLTFTPQVTFQDASMHYTSQEAMGVQTEWTSVGVMMHLPQEWTLDHQQASLHQLQIPNL